MIATTFETARVKTIRLAVHDWPGHRGSGVVPLRSMLRHNRAIGSRVPVRVLRSLELLIYREELMEMEDDDLIDVSITLTREAPSSRRGYRGRIDPVLLSAAGWTVGEKPLSYICGPAAFVEAAAAGLVAWGYDLGRIRTERFGGTGM